MERICPNSHQPPPATCSVFLLQPGTMGGSQVPGMYGKAPRSEISPLSDSFQVRMIDLISGSLPSDLTPNAFSKKCQGLLSTFCLESLSGCSMVPSAGRDKAQMARSSPPLEISIQSLYQAEPCVAHTVPAPKRAVKRKSWRAELQATWPIGERNRVADVFPRSNSD